MSSFFLNIWIHPDFDLRVVVAEADSNSRLKLTKAETKAE
jgi:hypothetical protein